MGVAGAFGCRGKTFRRPTIDTLQLVVTFTVTLNEEPVDFAYIR